MRKMFVFLVFMLLISTIVSFMGSVLAGDEENPEILDEPDDTNLPFLDIESAWFYEKSEEPEYLYTALKVNSLNPRANTVISIRWDHDGTEYVSGFNSYRFRDHVFRGGDPKRATYWQWNKMPECEGTAGQETNTITWKILKSNIGNPQKGDVLTKTRAAAVPGFPTSLFYFFLGLDYRDFAPSEQYTYGLDYVIQYSD
jgi:hypothetical protein